MDKISTSLRIRPDFGGDMGGSPARVSWDFGSVLVGSVEKEFVVVSTAEALLRALIAPSLSLSLSLCLSLSFSLCSSSELESNNNGGVLLFGIRGISRGGGSA